MKRPILCYIIFFFSLTGFLFNTPCFAQPKDTATIKTLINKIPESIKFSGYVDAYYAYYTDSVGTNNYQKFPVISPKSNVFGINIVQITAQYTAEKTRAIATLHYGDIPASAWSPVFNMIQEANAGVRLTKKIWLDAGFFKTHIGTEALLPKDNIASTLSIITFYEPLWQAGIKLTYTPSDKLLICLHILNGYNTFVDNSKSKSYGVAISYALGEKGNINYYNLVGEESPEGTKTKHFRFLNNFVFNYQLTKKFKTTIGVDYITQQHSGISDTNSTASIFSAILTFKYQAKPKFGIYARGETFSDKEGFLTGKFIDNTSNVTGYILNDATLGVEYKPADNAYIRLEGRDIIMDSRQQIFRTNGANTNNRLEAMVCVGVWF
jgi:Putative beta-barrel porin-2, OmpL-like. bbp2